MPPESLEKFLSKIVNDHVPWHEGGDDDAINCLCGQVFPYLSRWSVHLAREIVYRVNSDLSSVNPPGM